MRSNWESGNIDSFIYNVRVRFFFFILFCEATEVTLINTHIYKHKYIYLAHSKVGDDGLSFLPIVISVSISITTIYSSEVEFSFRRGGRQWGGVRQRAIYALSDDIRPTRKPNSAEVAQCLWYRGVTALPSFATSTSCGVRYFASFLCVVRQETTFILSRHRNMALQWTNTQKRRICTISYEIIKVVILSP